MVTSQKAWSSKHFLSWGGLQKFHLSIIPLNKHVKDINAGKIADTVITHLQSADLSSLAVLGDGEMIVKTFEIKDLPVIIPIDRLKVRVMKIIHMWNTAKRTALQNKSGVTGRELHLFLALPVV